MATMLELNEGDRYSIERVENGYIVRVGQDSWVYTSLKKMLAAIEAAELEAKETE